MLELYAIFTVTSRSKNKEEEKEMKKFGSILVVLAMVTTLIAGCGNKEQGEQADGKKIRVLTHMGEQITAIKDSFEKEYGVTVEVDNCNFDSLNDQYEVLLSSGSSEYDVIIADGPNVAAYVNRGYLEPLDEYFSKEEIQKFSKNLVEQGTVNDSFYGAPLGDSCTVMYYNKDLLKEAGIEWDFEQYNGTESRITWEELIELATKVKEKIDPEGTKGITPIEFGMPSDVYYMNTLPNSLGAKNISEDGMSVDGIINGKEWTKALSWYQDLVEKGVFSKGISGMEGFNQFYAGKSIFILMTTDSYNYALNGGMTPEQIGFTYQPCFKGYEDKVATACGNWTAAINVNSKNKNAAGEFVKWITYGEGNDLFLKKESMVPNMKSKFTEEMYAVNPALKIAVKESGFTSVARAVTPGFNEYYADVYALWENVRNGANVKEATEETVKKLDSELAYYK